MSAQGECAQVDGQVGGQTSHPIIEFGPNSIIGQVYYGPATAINIDLILNLIYTFDLLISVGCKENLHLERYL